MDLETILSIIGAIIAGIIGIRTARYSISREKEITKKALQKLSFLKLRQIKNVYNH
jgi:L-serine deaminase